MLTQLWKWFTNSYKCLHIKWNLKSFLCNLLQITSSLKLKLPPSPFLSPELHFSIFLFLYALSLFLPPFYLPHFTFHTFIYKCVLYVLLCEYVEPATRRVQRRTERPTSSTPALMAPMIHVIKLTSSFTVQSTRRLHFLNFLLVAHIHECVHVTYLLPPTHPGNTHTQNKQHMYTDKLSAHVRLRWHPGQRFIKLLEVTFWTYKCKTPSLLLAAAELNN